MRHGYCKNCDWWRDNVCYFQSVPYDIYNTSPNNYCPDYKRRKSEKSLSKWLAVAGFEVNQNEKQYEETDSNHRT